MSVPGSGDEVVVARIGKPHGLRGEVTVQLHTDDPETRFAVGSTIATQAGAGTGVPRTLTIRSTRVHQGVWLLGFEQIPDRTGAESLRGTRLVIDAADLEPGDDDGWYEDELRGLAVHTSDGARIGEVTRLEGGRRPGPAGGQRSTPVAARPGTSRGRDRAPRSTSRPVASSINPPAGLLDLNSDAQAHRRRVTVRLDVVSIFPEYLGQPLDLSLIGKARRDGLLDLRVHQLARLRPRPAPDRRRHPLRRRGRHGDEAPAVGRGARPRGRCSCLRGCPSAAHPVPGPGGMPFTQALAREPSPPSRGWRSPVGATRGSTSGSTSTPRRTSGCRCRSSRWGTTSSTAARSPCSRSSRRWPGCCPASSAMPPPSSRSRTRTACSSIPCTRSQPRGSRRARAGGSAGAALRRPRRDREPGGRSSGVARTADRRPDLLPRVPGRGLGQPTAWRVSTRPSPAVADAAERTSLRPRLLAVTEAQVANDDARGHPGPGRGPARGGPRRVSREWHDVGPSAASGRLVGSVRARTARPT